MPRLRIQVIPKSVKNLKLNDPRLVQFTVERRCDLWYAFDLVGFQTFVRLEQTSQFSS